MRRTASLCSIAAKRRRRSKCLPNVRHQLGGLSIKTFLLDFHIQLSFSECGNWMAVWPIVCGCLGDFE